MHPPTHSGEDRVCDHNALVDEEDRVHKLRIAMDITAAILRQHNSLSLVEANRLIENTRKVASTLCPGREETFDLVIGPRYLRILEERGLIG
jgi:hypothetical protein